MDADSTSVPTIATDLAPEPPPVLPKGPWGAWATLGWFILTYLTSNVVSIISATIFLFIQALLTHQELIAVLKGGLGDILWSTTILGGLLTIGLVIFLSSFKGYPLKDYLGLHSFSAKAFFLSLGGLMLLLAAWAALVHFTGYRNDKEFFAPLLKSTKMLPIFLVSICIIAPLSEELLFRGFLLTGLRHSRLGNTGAVLITAFLWGFIHFQYDIIAISNVFLLGCLFGYVKVKTDSIYLTITLHCLNNTLAAVTMLHLF